MKPAKTRIKITTRADGSVVYTAQHRLWGSWYDFDDYDGTSMFRKIEPYHCCMGDTFERIEWAQQVIDNYLEKIKETNDKRAVKEEYVKYP